MTGEGSSAGPRNHPPTRLGPYELLRPLARGGMADIFLARRESMGIVERYVAIKVLDRDRVPEDTEASSMFLDEARVVALLNHNNIASVLDVDVVDNWIYLAMEYVHGVDLRELLATCMRLSCSVPFDAAISIISAAAAGLDHAHRRCGPDGKPLRLVHRDVSLSNIMLGHDGAVKVVDFGIATTTLATVHTLPGIVRGKASYMSPEQCLGEKVDHRTDVFALGVVLYELTTGARCFSGKSDFERMLAVVRGEYILPSRLIADYPMELEQVITRALAIDANHRYASAAALIEALELVAVGRGWAVGTNVVARLMRELYGETPEPWHASPLPPMRSESDAETVRSQPIRRLARGSTIDLATRETGWVPQPQPAVELAPEPTPPALAEIADDEPTRGRRPVRRPSSPTTIV